jgi:hypothetical protein
LARRAGFLPRALSDVGALSTRAAALRPDMMMAMADAMNTVE